MFFSTNLQAHQQKKKWGELKSRCFKLTRHRQTNLVVTFCYIQELHSFSAVFVVKVSSNVSRKRRITYKDHTGDNDADDILLLLWCK